MARAVRTPISQTPSGLLDIEALRGNPLRFVCSWSGATAGYFPMHSHPVMELVYHPRGSGITTLDDGRKIQFEPHSTVIYPALLRHDQRMLKQGEDICIHVAHSPGEGKQDNELSEALYVPPSIAEPRRVDRFLR